MPFTDGLALRLVILGLFWMVAVAYVMRYAARVKADPTRSLVFDRKTTNEAHFLTEGAAGPKEFTGLHQIVLTLFALTFAVMVWGVSSQGWWMAQMSGLFLASVLGITERLGEARLVEAFARVQRDPVVTAFQPASGVVNIVTPTSDIVTGSLAIGCVPCKRWLHFCWQRWRPSSPSRWARCAQPFS